MTGPNFAKICWVVRYPSTKRFTHVMFGVHRYVQTCALRTLSRTSRTAGDIMKFETLLVEAELGSILHRSLTGYIFCTYARAYFRSGWTHHAQLGRVVRDPVVMRFTQVMSASGVPPFACVLLHRIDEPCAAVFIFANTITRNILLSSYSPFLTANFPFSISYCPVSQKNCSQSYNLQIST